MEKIFTLLCGKMLNKTVLEGYKLHSETFLKKDDAELFFCIDKLSHFNNNKPPFKSINFLTPILKHYYL